MSTDGAVDYDELLGRLKVLAAALDPVPRRVVEAARASLSWHSIDAELADLVYDSVVDEELVGARGGGARQLTFQAPDVTIELEVTPGSGRIVGQLVPPTEADVEVRHPNGTLTVRSDRLGHFRADGVPAGPVSVRCLSSGTAGRAAHTDWIVL
ncbi:MAG TPA: hypothetical protein VHF24_09730 [Acidimicrobiales bacterium]|nr:hypothetical protein [Acidimicrobiales bacterium]